MSVPIVEQLQVGMCNTRDITLAATLMCPDYPGVDLDEVIPDDEWPRNGKPLCTFVLRVQNGCEDQVAEWFEQHQAGGGLPVRSTKDYDRAKKELVDAMRTARAKVVKAKVMPA